MHEMDIERKGLKIVFPLVDIIFIAKAAAEANLSVCKLLRTAQFSAATKHVLTEESIMNWASCHLILGYLLYRVNYRLLYYLALVTPARSSSQCSTSSLSL